MEKSKSYEQVGLPGLGVFRVRREAASIIRVRACAEFQKRLLINLRKRPASSKAVKLLTLAMAETWMNKPV